MKQIILCSRNNLTFDSQIVKNYSLYYYTDFSREKELCMYKYIKSSDEAISPETLTKLNVEPINLKGTKRTVHRMVYKSADGRYFMKYYDDYVELEPSLWGGYNTVNRF